MTKYEITDYDSIHGTECLVEREDGSKRLVARVMLRPSESVETYGPVSIGILTTTIEVARQSLHKLEQELLRKTLDSERKAACS